MVLDAARNYLQLASGLTEVTRQRAMSTAKALLAGSGGELLVPGALGQAAALADEIMATAKANRELLLGLVRAEVDRTVGRLGLVTRDDVASLQRTVDELAARVRVLSGEAPPADATTGRKVPRAKAAPKKAAPKKADDQAASGGEA